jgi:hypothetical protein
MAACAFSCLNLKKMLRIRNMFTGRQSPLDSRKRFAILGMKTRCDATDFIATGAWMFLDEATAA